MKTLALAVLCALGLAAHADTGPGPAPGHVLQPSPVNPATAGRGFHPDGMGGREPAARSPAGRLYDLPLDPGEQREPRANGWIVSGFAEGGALHTRGDERGFGFGSYADLRDGGYLNLFALAAEKPAAALFFEATGGAVGRDDQYYRLMAGRYNDWKVAAFHDGIPMTATSRYRSLWSGLGTGQLTLTGLRPGGTTSAAATEANIREALAAAPESALEVVRKRSGVRVDKKLGEAWSAYASFTDEKREGSRPLGAVFGGGGGGGNMDIAESIAHSTRDLVAGLQYNDALNSVNVRAAASFFRNEIDTLTFQNPVYVSLNGSGGLAPALFTHGRFDLAPDNQHYNVKAEYARAIPSFHRANFTAAVALGWMRQDDDLLAPTDQALTGGTVSAGGASLANAWNTRDALSRASADARLDTRLLDLGLTLKPAGGLDVRGKLRYYETRNASQYVACNPLTGQWGRLLNDGSGLSLVGAHTGARVNPAGTRAGAYDAAGCDLEAVRGLNLVPAAGNIPIAAVPNDYRQLNAVVGADYRLTRTAVLNASLEREGFERDLRERDETWEDKLKLGYVERGLIPGTLRLAYEHARRGGSDYTVNPYRDFRSAGMGPLPAANGANVASWVQVESQFRAFDLADRRQDTLTARADYGIAAGLDLAASLRVRDARFPAEYGRTGHQKSNSFTLDLTYEVAPRAMVYGFVSHQDQRMAQRGIQSNACQLGYTYYFYSNGQVLGTATGAAAPATPAGATLVATQDVGAGNWRSVCVSASATSPLFPESRAWQVDTRDRQDVIGAGFKVDFARARLDASFTRALGRTRIRYAYNAAALGLTPAQAALAGEGLPDIRFAQNVLDASLTVPLGRQVSMRLLVRHETGRIRDWHYDGVAEDAMPTSNAVYLDAGPADYRSTLFGLFFQVRL